MALLLVLTSSPSSEPVLPALELLSYRVRTIPAVASELIAAPRADVVIVDGRSGLAAAKSLCTLIRATGDHTPLLLVVTEGGMSAVNGAWGIDDVMLDTSGPAEVDARMRLALARSTSHEEPVRVQASGITIDEQSYAAKLHGRPLDLTYKEFQLLHFLATHPARVFTREQLLSEVWGYDYYGGTRTVDVHVRRLRAKLGDQDHVIGTVRNVGYRFNKYEDETQPSLRDRIE